MALLRQLAAGALPPASLLFPSPVDEARFRRARLPMAQSLLQYWLPAPPEEEAYAEALRRTAVACLLLPLVTLLDNRLPFDPRQGLVVPPLPGLSDLIAATRRICATAPFAMGEEQTQRRMQAIKALEKALADPRYGEECCRLLADLAETPAGKHTLAEALIAYERRRPNQPLPPAIHVIAAGAPGGAAGSGLALLVYDYLRRGVESESAPPGAASERPRPAAFDRAMIPCDPGAWRAELRRRNEHFGAPQGYSATCPAGPTALAGGSRGSQRRGSGSSPSGSPARPSPMPSTGPLSRPAATASAGGGRRMAGSGSKNGSASNPRSRTTPGTMPPTSRRL
ncbi:MAG: hypothetical protein RMK84_13040 [Oscillochloridaceae bacterium]|nr:hypothetical protein [Chloroflexaceae bacterium]MDW8391046.1 hypothetical protein [Oscillochloridaceae bacterium]